MHCVWISVISVFPLIYCGLYFAIKYTIITETEAAQQAFPDIVRVSSSGPAGELYPDSLGEYELMTDIIYNGLPVYQYSAGEDRYIINIGELIISYLSIMNIHIILANSWFITHEISNSGPREFISTAEEKGQIADGLDWQYNRYPKCQTIRSDVRIFFQRISVCLMFHCLQWTRKTYERISRRCYGSG